METNLIRKCLKSDRSAQRDLYEKYKTRWFMICLRYMSTKEDAEDALQNGLIKVFTKLSLYDSEKSKFTTWSSKVIVNECIGLLRKKNHVFSNSEELKQGQQEDQSETVIEQLSAKELTGLINTLPLGYRVVFNMYVLEGYSHSEISKELDISVGTSKSQLFKAKRILRQRVEQLFKV